jgi:hypothetical protein
VADAALYSAKRAGKNCIVVDGETARAAGAIPDELPDDVRRHDFGEGIRDEEALVELDLGVLQGDPGQAN